MVRNNEVYLLVGQRGSGKSEYCKKLLANQPELSAVSRDEILLRFFGSEHSDPYSGSIEIGVMVMCRLLRRKLSTQTGIKLILDCWTGKSSERKSILKKLRQYGANRVTALYFMTPHEAVSKWFWKKPGVAKVGEMTARQGQGLVFFCEDAPKRDYEVFHEYAREIDSDGFDQVLRINPLKPLVVLQ